MFAIVDRTNLATDKYNPNTIQPPPVYLSGIMPYPQPPNPPTANMIAIPDGQFPTNPPPTLGGPVPYLTGTYEGIHWIIQNGSNVLIDTGANQELVNVASVNAGNNPTSPTPLLPPTITIQGSNKTHSGPIAITPVNTFGGATVPAGTPITVGSGPVQIQISPQSTTFEGVPWNLQVGTNVLIWDVVNAPEVVQIVPPPAGQPPGIYIQAVNTNGTFQYMHQSPFTISYPIPTPGNPGPQANFDMRQVPWVVRHFSIIN
jgi:hypothetical protein